jgi:hypothetical protein
MKPTLLLACVLGLTAWGAPRVVAAAAPRAEVIFDHPEKFADVRDQYVPTEKGREGILGSLRDFIVREAGRRVPAGCKLTLTFTDIRLAGDFEPWRGPRFEDIRIVRSIYPPDFKFTYVLTDPAGREIKRGREDILDMAFEFRRTLDEQDPLRYEKAMLSDWMRTALRGVRTAGS